MTANKPRRDLVKSVLVPAAVLACCLSVFTATANAEQVIFTIDPTQTALTTLPTDNVLGAFQPQSTDSLTATASGHFLVSFDPLSDTPATIQVLGSLNGYPNNGYFQYASTNSGLPGAAPGLSLSTPDPANIAGRTAGGEIQFAYRNIVWDFSSAPIAGTGGSFPDATSFNVKQGYSDAIVNGVASRGSLLGQNHLTTGTWTLSQSAPGSGAWTLSLDETFDYTYDTGASTSPRYAGTVHEFGHIVSTAQFGAANVATVPPPMGSPVQAEALGGAGTTGGVTVDFNETTTGGALSVQQVPDNTALTPAALDALAANPLFLASTASLSANAQIWDVQYAGSLNGGMATLVFHYDPALLPQGTDESQLGIWHFSSLRNQWEFGGTVDPSADTITYMTDSFSPFELGVAVPEPSSVALAGLAAVALAAQWSSERRSARRRPPEGR
ncbi:MAG: PEP-CTERM sorting domain-containing protein [Planctomycetia bacterium]|nr:PEP-CTERM sorting domain-containing protein [Planctomycetia bacterium]